MKLLVTALISWYLIIQDKEKPESGHLGSFWFDQLVQIIADQFYKTYTDKEPRVSVREKISIALQFHS